MQSFFIDYRDPIFGILILVALVFVIFFANYWWRIYKAYEETQSIESFIKRFEVLNDESEYQKILNDFGVKVESLGLLAHIYTKSGDYEKAINIYLIALKRINNRVQKQYILTELGKTYFKAGFLKRSTDIFLQSLQLYPRNKEALTYITVAYESLREYKNAMNALNVLDELQVDVSSQKAYVESLLLVSNDSKSDEEIFHELLKISKNAFFVGRIAWEFAIKRGLKIDNSFLHSIPTSYVQDLWWYAPKDCFEGSVDPLQNAILNTRKGEIVNSDAPFELNCLSRLRHGGYNGASLSFSYVCNACKQVFPIHFYRCPQCHVLGSAIVEASISPLSYEENNSFQ